MFEVGVRRRGVSKGGRGQEGQGAGGVALKGLGCLKALNPT